MVKIELLLFSILQNVSRFQIMATMINRRSLIVGASAALAYSYGFRSAQAQVGGHRLGSPPLVDLANWMSVLSKNIVKFEDWPLKKIVMPGTHDSFMYKGMLPADFAKTQNLDIIGQLNEGARFFDFRIGYFRKEGTYWVSASSIGVECVGNVLSGADWYGWGHGGPDRLVDVKVRDVLVGIKGWLDNHPGEVVILSVSGATTRLPPVGANALDLKSLFTSTLAERLYIPGQDLPQSLPLAKVKGKVILLNSDANNDPFGGCAVLRNEVLRDCGWANSQSNNFWLSTVAQKIDALRPAGSSADQDFWMMVIQGQLTPCGSIAEGAPNSFYDKCQAFPLCPQDLAKGFNPWLANLIYGQWKGRALNVVSCDYIEIGHLAQTIVAANYAVS